MRFSRSAPPLFAALVSIVCGGCGDSSPSGGGPADTTPPGIAASTALDRNHIQVVFNESVREATAEVTAYYRIIERAPLTARAAGPGDEVPVSAAVLHADAKTLVISTGAPMSSAPYDLLVHGVEDLAGNRLASEITSAFTGSVAPDVTPPALLSRQPAASATGVAVGQAVVVQFSETMDYGSVLAAFHWTSSGGAVAWEARSEDQATFAFMPLAALDRLTLYTVTLGAEARDSAGNVFVGATWNFQTTNQVDDTPPALTASNPAHGATHVAVTANLSMTFSEAVQPYLDEVLVAPDIGDGLLVWSSDGRTFTFDPFADLLPATQYSVFIPPAAVKDLAGNSSIDAITVVFTTGAALAAGSVAGTLGGGPASSAASNPSGALVVAADRPPFTEGDFGIAGTAVVSAGGAYRIDHVPDGTFWPLAFKETNGDGRINPELGDAFGVYGVDFTSQTGEPDSVTLAGGGATQIDFDLFDPVSLSGTVVYEGTRYPECCYRFFVGVFDTTGFDPGNPTASDPVHGTDGQIPDGAHWFINQFDHGLEPGTYYVGAYMDANFNSMPDAGDPLAMYESGGAPIPLSLGHGTDRPGIAIRLPDPPVYRTQAPHARAWPARTAAPPTALQRAYRRAVAALQRL